MRLIKYSIILILVLVMSCNDENRDEDLNNTLNETPEILDETPDPYSKSISRRYSSDIISKLYFEALEKSEVLNELNDKINNIGNTKNDSIESYVNYDKINNDYWKSANKYIEQIEDTELRASTLDIFKILESEYKTKVLMHEEKLAEINQRTISLNDQLILLKLSITKSMIKSYQINELPDINTLENIIKEYDALIKETKEQIEGDKQKSQE